MVVHPKGLLGPDPLRDRPVHPARRPRHDLRRSLGGDRSRRRRGSGQSHGRDAGGRSSNLDKLFDAWGISVTGDKFVGDDRYALQVMGPGGRPVRDIGLVGIDPDGLDKEDVVTAGLTLVNLGFAGAITGCRQGAREADAARAVERSGRPGQHRPARFHVRPFAAARELQPDRQALHAGRPRVRQGAERLPERPARGRARGQQAASGRGRESHQRRDRRRRRFPERPALGADPEFLRPAGGQCFRQQRRLRRELAGQPARQQRPHRHPRPCHLHAAPSRACRTCGAWRRTGSA